MKLSISNLQGRLTLFFFFFLFLFSFSSKPVFAQGKCNGGCQAASCAGISLGTICCENRSEASCKSVASCGCSWTPDQPVAPQPAQSQPAAAPTQSCASGWQCGSACADSNTVASFTAVWCDPKGRWLFEAGQNLGISCGGNQSQQKSTGCGATTPAPTKPTPIPLAKPCSDKGECQAQCDPYGKIFCGGSLNGCMPGTKTCETWVYELTGMTPQVQQAAAEQQRKQAEAAAAAQIANQEEINKALADTAGSCVDRKTQAPDPSCGALPNRYNCGQSPGCLWVSNRGSQTRPNNTPCTNNDQCQSGFCKYEGAYALCAAKEAGVTSKPNGDSCSIGSNCISNFCSLVTKKCQDFYAPRAIGDICATKANCASGLTCFNGLCATEQAQTQTVTQTIASEAPACRAIGGTYCTGSDAGCTKELTTCANAGESCAAACQKKQTRIDNSSGGNWAPTLKKEGETCTSDWECKTGRCRGLNGTKQCVTADKDPTPSSKYKLGDLSCFQCTIAETINIPQACIYASIDACVASDEFQKAKESKERATTNNFRLDGLRCIACSAAELIDPKYKSECIYSSTECQAVQTGKAQELSSPSRFKLVDGACFQCNKGEVLANLCPFEAEASCKDSPTGLVYLDTSQPSPFCSPCKVSDKGSGKLCIDAVSCTDLINKTKENVTAQSSPTDQIDGDTCVKENGECLCTTPTCLCKPAPFTAPFIINQNDECVNPNPKPSEKVSASTPYKFDTATNQCLPCPLSGSQTGCTFSNLGSCLSQESDKYFLEPTLKLCRRCLNSDLATPNKCVSENDCKSLLTSAPPTQSQEINGDSCDDRTGKCICSTDFCACKGTSPDGKVNAGTISKSQRCFNPYVNKSDKPTSPLGTKKLRELCENGPECETGICKLSSDLTKQCASTSDLGLKGAFCISSNQCLSGACDTTVQKCTGVVLTKKYIYPGEVCSPNENCLCRTSSGLVKEMDFPVCRESSSQIYADRCDPLRGECTCQTDVCSCISLEKIGKVYKGQDCYNINRKDLNPSSICQDNKCSSPSICTASEKNGKVFAFCDRPGFEEDFYLVVPGETCPTGVRACYCKNLQIGGGQICPADPVNGDFCGGQDKVCQSSRCEAGTQTQGNETGACGELNKNFCCQNVSCFKFTNQTECLSNPACNWTTQSGKCFNLPFQVINDRRFAEAKNENPTKPVSLSACSDKCENPLGCNCNNIQCFGNITMGASCSQLPASDLYGGTQWIARQRTLMEKCGSGLVNPAQCLLGWAYQVVDVPTLGGISGVNNSVQSVRKCQEDRDSGIRETNCAGEVASTAASGLFTAGDLIGLGTITKNWTQKLIQRFSPASTIDNVAKASLKSQVDDLLDPALSFTDKNTGKTFYMSKEANKISTGERARFVRVETKGRVFMVTEEEAAIAKAFRDSELTTLDKIKAQVQDIGQNISRTFNKGKEAQKGLPALSEDPALTNPGVYNPPSNNVQIFKAFNGEEVKIPEGSRMFNPTASFSDKAIVINRLDKAGINFEPYIIDGNAKGVIINGVTDPQRINKILNRAAEGRPIFSGFLADTREQAQDFLDKFFSRKTVETPSPILSQQVASNGQILSTANSGGANVPMFVSSDVANQIAKKGQAKLNGGFFIDRKSILNDPELELSTVKAYQGGLAPPGTGATITTNLDDAAAASNIPDQFGNRHFGFSVHGERDSLQISGVPFDPESATNMFIDAGVKSGTPEHPLNVYSMSCKTGLPNGCDPSVAERVANQLSNRGFKSTTVYAPLGDLSVTEDFKFQVVKPDLPEDVFIPVEGPDFIKITIDEKGVVSIPEKINLGEILPNHVNPADPNKIKLSVNTQNFPVVDQSGNITSFKLETPENATIINNTRQAPIEGKVLNVDRKGWGIAPIEEAPTVSTSCLDRCTFVAIKGTSSSGQEYVGGIHYFTPETDAGKLSVIIEEMNKTLGVPYDSIDVSMVRGRLIKEGEQNVNAIINEAKNLSGSISIPNKADIPISTEGFFDAKTGTVSTTIPEEIKKEIRDDLRKQFLGQ